MKTRFIVTVLALLLALAAPAARADHDRPFKGELESVATSFALNESGVLTIEGTISGHGTIIGKITGSFTYYVFPDGSFTGTLTKVAANGDEVHETFVGAFTSATTSAGSFTIVDGTGRFANAAGGGGFTGAVLSQTVIDIAFTGTIAGPK